MTLGMLRQLLERLRRAGGEREKKGRCRHSRVGGGQSPPWVLRPAGGEEPASPRAASPRSGRGHRRGRQQVQCGAPPPGASGGGGGARHGRAPPPPPGVPRTANAAARPGCRGNGTRCLSRSSGRQTHGREEPLGGAGEWKQEGACAPRCAVEAPPSSTVAARPVGQPRTAARRPTK